MSDTKTLDDAISAVSHLLDSASFTATIEDSLRLIALLAQLRDVAERKEAELAALRPWANVGKQAARTWPEVVRAMDIAPVVLASLFRELEAEDAAH